MNLAKLYSTNWTFSINISLRLMHKIPHNKTYNKTVNGGQLLNQIYLEDISTLTFHSIYSSEGGTSVISKKWKASDGILLRNKLVKSEEGWSDFSKTLYDYTTTTTTTHPHPSHHSLPPHHPPSPITTTTTTTYHYQHQHHHHHHHPPPLTSTSTTLILHGHAHSLWSPNSTQ